MAFRGIIGLLERAGLAGETTSTDGADHDTVDLALLQEL